MDNSKRVVVTGLGLINAIGENVEESFGNVVNGVNGIKEVSSMDTSACYSHMGAEVKKDFAVDGGEDAGRMDRVSLLAVKAAREALEDSGLVVNEDNADRVGVIFGSCVGGAISIQKFFTEREQGLETDATDIVKMPIGAIANNIAKIAGVKGVVTNVGNACAASTISIKYASDLIREGIGDAFIVGGSDSFSALAFGGFIALHAIDVEPCHPLNRYSGITLGEGSGVLIVESYEHAMARGAKIYCDVLGGGISSDAFHITAPRDDSEGQMNAMKWALESSDLKPAAIDYINGHATGTSKNDTTETAAMETIFGDNADTSVDSTKSMVGHCLGAAGAVEAVYSVKALTQNVVPPTIGYTEEDLENLKARNLKLDYTPNVKRERELHTVMTNNFAFGGCNCSVIFTDEEHEVKAVENHKVVVTGAGLVSPLGNSLDAYLENVKTGATLAEDGTYKAEIGKDDFAEHEIKLAFYRKLDKLSQIQVVSGRSCLKNAGVTVTPENETKIGMIIGTADGPGTEIIDFHEDLIKGGLEKGSAFKFPNTVYNAAGGYLSINSGVKGVNVTLTNGMQAGLQSVAYAYNVVKEGTEDMMMACGMDENTDTMQLLYDKQGFLAKGAVAPYSGNGKAFTLGEGAVSMMLESAESAKARQAEVWAEVAGYAMTHESVTVGTLAGSDAALDKAIEKACEMAGIKVSDVDAVVGFGNGNDVVDAIEMNSYARVFGDAVKTLPVFNIKEKTGEGRAAVATLSAVHAALILAGKLDATQPAFILADGKATRTTVDTRDMKNIVVTSFAQGGSYTAIVLKKAN